jgi:hypothetical protein
LLELLLTTLARLAAFPFWAPNEILPLHLGQATVACPLAGILLSGILNLL